jgi:hypothetical protein
LFSPLTVFGQLDSTIEAKALEACGGVYSVPEELPKFPGGDDAFLNQVWQIVNGAGCDKDGKAKVVFTVDNTGQPIGIQTIGLTSECSEHFLNEFDKLPKWAPGLNRGNPVCVKIVSSLKPRKK